ncbi:hypothetical protein N9C83_02900 [Opitutales bacterium]|nr:hypothetical protein [Opitutales bacterium]
MKTNLFTPTLLAALALSFSSCGKKEVERAPRPMPESAKLLVDATADTADAVLLHTVDTATEFPAAISSLEPDVAEPEVRAVQQLPAPSTSGSSNGDSQQTVQVVEPVRASAPLKQDWGV